MNKPGHGIRRAGVILAIVALIGSYAAGQHVHSAPGVVPPKAAKPQPMKQSPPTIDAKQLSAIQEAVVRAIGHLEAGHQQDALKELKQIQSSLESLRQVLDKNAAPSFVNDRCPILGTPIDSAKVPAALIRVHEGHKVAFCCTGCPQAWDRLGNPEKTAKLAVVTAQPPQPGVPPTNMTDPSHQQGMQHEH